MTDTDCTKCGHRNEPGARFCSSCGAPVDVSGSTHETQQHVAVVVDVTQPIEVDPPLELVDDIPMLVVLKGRKRGSRFALDQETTTAGRHPDSDIFLDDVTVSRRHADFVRVGHEVLVRDVGSLNGTYVNRQRVDEAPLRHGDEIHVGKFRLVFLVGGDE